MGCDIHVFVEYRRNGEWVQLGAFRPGRDYHMFGLLAGVRDESVSPVVEPRGFPDDCSFETWLANQSIRTEDDKLEAGALARLRMGRILGHDMSHLASPCQDWHSHSWLASDELAMALQDYAEDSGPENAWKALHVLLTALPEGRIVFFFDN